MERKNLTYLANKIFEFIDNMQYEQSGEFQAFKLEMLINIDKFLNEYEQNTYIITSNEIPQKTCSKQKEEYLNVLMCELVKFIRTIEPAKLQTTMNFEYDKGELIISISKLLNPKNYHGNIEVLRKLEKKINNIDTKKHKC